MKTLRSKQAESEEVELILNSGIRFHRDAPQNRVTIASGDGRIQFDNEAGEATRSALAKAGIKSDTTGRAGGLADHEPLKAVRKRREASHSPLVLTSITSPRLRTCRGDELDLKQL
jgi:hypothetical protein